MEIGIYAGALVLAYLLGSLNMAMVVSKVYKQDIREMGSKNAGTTNVLRSFGKSAAAIVFIGDILKAVLAIAIVRVAARIFIALYPDMGLNLYLCVYLAGIGAVLGHNFPLYFGFRGGKGIATSTAVILMVSPLYGLISTLIGVLLIALTRYVSLGSILGSVAYFVIAIIALCTGHADWYFLAFAFVIAALAVIRHHANIGRLIHGTENKLGSKKEAKPEE